MKQISNEFSGTFICLDKSNIDTDQIIPKQFLKSIKKTGFGDNLFDGWRYLDEGTIDQETSSRMVNKDFIFNNKLFADSNILVSGENFGCGSSREHAVWALKDFGIKTVIAESFADIFYNNSFKNGLLPIKVTADQREALLADAKDKENPELEIDLPSQEIRRPNGVVIKFEIDPFRKKCLLEGLDDIGLTMQKSNEIENFESKMSSERPWL